MRSDLAAARRVLRRRWGHPDFRAVQRPVVRAMLAGRDVLAVLPTGAGKSVCFQLPALMAEGLTLVISPLISLMEDQVAGARRRGIPAAALTSSMPAGERREVARRVADGEVRLLYVAPERLGAAPLGRLLDRVGLARVAVDEAHCISEWGHAFRPDYRRIGTFVAKAATRPGGRPRVAALTATATPATRRDIAASLGLDRPATVVAPVDRPNLVWAARRVRTLGRAVREVTAAVRDTPGAAIVYAPSRRRAVGTARALRRLGIGARPYHAGLPADARSRIQEAFLGGRLRVVCATSAFGMGVDHPEIRLVCHLGAPGSLEAYVQEAGRAGRDGERARCLLISHRGDADLQRRLAAHAWPSARLLERVWDAMPEGRTVGTGDVVAGIRAGGSALPGLPRRVWRATGPERGGGPDREIVEAALRLLRQFGCVRTCRRGARAPGTGPPGGSAGRDVDADDDAAGASPETRRAPPPDSRRAPKDPNPDPGSGDERWVRGPDALRRRIDFGAPARGRRRAARRLEAMRGYVRTRRCRRAVVADYFGEEAPDCAGCDRCGDEEASGAS